MTSLPTFLRAALFAVALAATACAPGLDEASDEFFAGLADSLGEVLGATSYGESERAFLVACEDATCVPAPYAEGEVRGAVVSAERFDEVELVEDGAITELEVSDVRAITEDDGDVRYEASVSFTVTGAGTAVLEVYDGDTRIDRIPVETGAAE